MVTMLWMKGWRFKSSMSERVKPTINTKYMIDLAWWNESGRNFRVELLGHLCEKCKHDLAASTYSAEMVDWIDPDTGEVRRVDALWHSLQTCCSQKPEFISAETSLPTALFRLLLANGNEPLSPLEMWQRLGRRNPETILRLLTNGRRFYGIRTVGNNTH